MEHGTETNQEPLQEAVSSSQEEVSSSEQKQRTFTSEEVAKMQSSYDKQISKLSKELEPLKSAYQQLLDAQAQREREAYEKELEEAEGDPKLMALLKREQAIKEKELAQKQKEADFAGFEEDLARANEADRQEYAKELATEHGISVDALLEFDDKTPEAMEATAKRLAKLAKPEAKSPMRPYSGAGAGAGIDLSKMSPRDIIKMGLGQK